MTAMIHKPHRQSDVEIRILEALENEYVKTTQQVTVAVKLKLDLSPEDLKKASKRENESKIDQIIANSLQELRPLCKNRLVERVAVGEFRITARGLQELVRHRNKMKELDQIANDLGLEI